MGCMAGVARLLLVVINIIFLLLGLSLTVVGFILRYGRSIYQPVLDFGIYQLQKVLDSTSLQSFDVEQVDLGTAMVSISIGLIVGGLFIFGLAFFGCCGACCKFSFFLYIYAIVIVVFVAGEAVAIGLLYGKPELVKDNVKSTVSSYEGLSSSEVNSLTWNIIMIQFKCCGIDSYKDFDKTQPWADLTNTAVNVQLETPVSCCKTLPTSDTDFSCAQTFNEATSNGLTGCYQTLWDKSFGNTAIAIPVLVICGIIQIAFIWLAIVIAKDENNKVAPM